MQGSVDHRVKTDNKLHSVTFSFTSDCCETVGAFEICDNSHKCKVRDELVDQQLCGFLEDGRVPRQRVQRATTCGSEEREHCLLPVVATGLLA